ncbi:MAG: hypothetical protein LRZ84_20595 [Desertifilum sp.]|nr:hypothetical protein [Desertifilum sp.]
MRAKEFCQSTSIQTYLRNLDTSSLFNEFLSSQAISGKKYADLKGDKIVYGFLGFPYSPCRSRSFPNSAKILAANKQGNHSTSMNLGYWINREFSLSRIGLATQVNLKETKIAYL